MILPKKNGTKIIYILTLVLLFLALHGYQFNTNDHAEHLPQVYQMLHPDTYKGDFFLEQYHKMYNVRIPFQYTVYFFSKYTKVEYACFLLTLLCLFVQFFSWFEISNMLTQNTNAGYWVIALSYLILNRITIGGNHLAENMLTSSTFALALCPLSLWLFLRNRPLVSGMCYAAALIYQPLFALQFAFVFVGIIGIYRKFERKHFIFFITPALLSILVLSYLLQPYFMQHADANDTTLFYKLYYSYHSKEHFRLEHFPQKKIFAFTALSVCILLLIFFDRHLCRYRFMLAIFMGHITMCYLLFEHFSIESIGSLQFYKIVPFVVQWYAILLVDVALRRLTVCLHFRIPAVYTGTILIILAIAALFFIYNSDKIPFKKIREKHYAFSVHEDPLYQMHAYIRQNTPVQALILAPPEDLSFACEAQRAQPFQPYAVIHTPAYFTQWYRMCKQYYGVDVLTCNSDNFRSKLSEGYYTMTKLTDDRVDYLLTHLGKAKNTKNFGICIYTSENWALFYCPKHSE